MRPLPFVLLSALACACAAPASRFPRPTVLAEPELRYEASFRPTPLPPPDPGIAGDRGDKLAVRFRLLDLSSARAVALEGERLGPAAWRSRLAELPDFTPEEIKECPNLELGSGASTRFVITNQRAYVAAFELSGDQRTLVADPVIETYSTGLALLLSADHTASGVSLALDVTQCTELAEPSARNLCAPGFPAGLSVQVPEIYTQRIQTRDALAPDECLVLSWNHARAPERRLVLLVTAREAGPLGTR